MLEWLSFVGDAVVHFSAHSPILVVRRASLEAGILFCLALFIEGFLNVSLPVFSELCV